jgi:hypothetical protein
VLDSANQEEAFAKIQHSKKTAQITNTSKEAIWNVEVVSQCAIIQRNNARNKIFDEAKNS